MIVLSCVDAEVCVDAAYLLLCKPIVTEDLYRGKLNTNASLCSLVLINSQNYCRNLTGYDGDIPAFITEKYFLMVNFDALYEFCPRTKLNFSLA